MEHFFHENWVLLHLGLIFSITLAQMLVVYVLSGAQTPPRGLGLFTVYFMAALLGWVAFTLQQGSTAPMAVDVPSAAAILNSYILFMAAGQRAGLHHARILLGLICLPACLSVFFLPADKMFVMQASAATLFFTGTGTICTLRAVRERNVGDAIIAGAALLMAVSLPLTLYQAYFATNFPAAQAINFAAHSCAYVLVALGFLTSVLIEYQQHLSHLATEDPLTRLFNRRGLEDALHVSFAQASRQELSTSAVMLDIDHFKKVNDSFGHDTGDQVIRAVATILERLCRASDVVARTGGEEFLIILPDTSLESARVLAERIRSAIGDHPLIVEEQRIAITVSLGAACSHGDVDLSQLTREADQAMYLAKRGGRNRVASVDNRPVQMSSAAGTD